MHLEIIALPQKEGRRERGREDIEGLPADRPVVVPGKAAQPLCMRAFLETLPFLSERKNSLSGN